MNVEEVQRRLWEQSKAHKENRKASLPLFPTSTYDLRMDLKQAALKRDGYQCRGCGSLVVSETSHADHIKPVHQFASFEQANTLNNMQTLCLYCHRQKTRSEQEV
ncbi:MAG: HNH endonuclease [Planctomycetaceae bacterium]|nr:HNH endonuclease [Planctomycetaceae bacterium]